MNLKLWISRQILDWSKRKLDLSHLSETYNCSESIFKVWSRNQLEELHLTVESSAKLHVCRQATNNWIHTQHPHCWCRQQSSSFNEKSDCCSIIVIKQPLHCCNKSYKSGHQTAQSNKSYNAIEEAVAALLAMVTALRPLSLAAACWGCWLDDDELAFTFGIVPVDDLPENASKVN